MSGGHRYSVALSWAAVALLLLSVDARTAHRSATSQHGRNRKPCKSGACAARRQQPASPRLPQPSLDSHRGGAFFGLGGTSVAVSWGFDGNLRSVPLQPQTLLRVEDTPSSHLSFGQWAKTAAWKRRLGDSSALMEQLLQFVELEHPVPLKMCKDPAFLEVEKATLQDCLQALGGSNSTDNRLNQEDTHRMSHVINHSGDSRALEQQLMRREKTMGSKLELAVTGSGDVEGKINSALNTGVFKGLRSKPAFIVDVSVFSFDLDALEIRLHELSRVVDLFTIIEMPVTYQGKPKPLIWDRNKDRPRFRAFQNRVLHAVVDDKDIMAHLGSKQDKDSAFMLQKAKGREKLQSMLQSLLTNRHLKGQELVVNFGHADEIPSARNMALMKQCEPEHMPIYSGTWMPLGRFDRASRAERPTGSNFTHRSSAFHDSSEFVAGGLKGGSGHLFGGWHLSGYAYPPNVLLHLLTCSHCAGIPKETVHMLQKGPAGVHELWESLSSPQRGAALKELEKEIPYREHPELLRPPNVVQCNPERFEVWFGHSDRRLNVKPADGKEVAVKDGAKQDMLKLVRRSD